MKKEKVLAFKEDIPEHVKKALIGKGVDITGLKIVISSNMDLNHPDFGQTWLCADKDNIYVICGNTLPVSNASKGRALTPFKKARKLFEKEKSSLHVKGEERYEGEPSIISIKMSDIQSFAPVNYVNSGAILGRCNNEDRVIILYPKGQNILFAPIAGWLDKLRQGKDLTDDDAKGNERIDKCPKCGRYYSDPMRKICIKCLNKKTLFRRVLSYAQRYKYKIAIIMMFILLSSALNLAAPYISGRFLFDEVLIEGGRFEGRIGFAVFIMFSTQLASLIIQIIYGRINSKISGDIVYDLKTDVFSAMQKLSLGFFTNKQTGVLMNRVNSDATELQYLFHDGIPMFIVNVVTLLGIGGILLWMNWQLALAVLIPVPIAVYIMRTVYPKLWTMFSRRFKRNASLNATVNNALTGVRVVKAFGRENSEVQRFGMKNQGVYDVTLEVGNFTATLFPFLGWIMGLGSFLVWVFGGWAVLRDTITVGTLFTFVGYTTMFYGPIRFMTQVVNWWSQTMNAAQRIFEIIDAEPEVFDKKDQVPMANIEGEVVLDKITFGYEKTKPVLIDIDLHVKPGEIIGLVGHSGAGKSTLINLIARLYNVDKGAIYIDGRNIKDIPLEDLRSQIGMVLQDTFLFNGTIADNIRYAKPRASLEDVMHAAKIANAHDFITNLPNGYDTLLGSKGHKLSGGEQQRVSIARAILHNPKILFLDEATASVDTQTEMLIQEALERLVHGRTTFAIAHRLSTLRNAHRLFVLEKGKNIECGTHEELIEKKGVYYKLLQTQREALKIQGVG